MNKAYRVIWNATLAAWVVASELAVSKGKSATSGRRATTAIGRLGVIGSLLLGLLSFDALDNRTWAGAVVACSGANTGNGSTANTSGSNLGVPDSIGCTNVFGAAMFENSTTGVAADSAAILVGTGGVGSGKILISAPNGLSIKGLADMNMNRITGLANGQVSTTSKDAVNGSQLWNSMRYFKAAGLQDGTDDASVTTSTSVAIGASAVSAQNAVALGSKSVASASFQCRDSERSQPVAPPSRELPSAYPESAAG